MFFLKNKEKMFVRLFFISCSFLLIHWAFFHVNIKNGNSLGLVEVIRKIWAVLHAFSRNKAENFFVIYFKLQVQLAIPKPIKQDNHQHQLYDNKIEINFRTALNFLIIHQPQFQNLRSEPIYYRKPFIYFVHVIIN